MVMIEWLLGSTYMQSVPITTNVVSSKPCSYKVYSIKHYLIKIVS